MDRSKWEYKKLGEVCSLFSGFTPKPEEIKGIGKYPYFKVADMNTSGNERELRYTLSYLEDSKKFFKKNSIVFPKNGAAIATNKKRILAVDSIVDLNTAGVYADDSFLFYPYLYYYILNTDFKEITRGGAIPTLDLKELKSRSIYIPPLSDQQRIVAELDCLNEMIAVKQEQLKEFDKLAQSIFYDMFGDPVANEKGWKQCILNDVSETITDGDHMPPPKSDSGVPFVTISNVNKDTRQIDFSNTFFVPREYYDSIPESKKPRIGDVLYTVTGSYGIPIIIREEKEFCFQRHIGLIRPNKEIEPIFLCMWAGCQSIKSFADRYATGVAQKTVSLKVLRNFPMIVPPLILQQQFAEKISAIEAQKELVKQSIAETQALLDYTMDYYFNE